MTPSTSCIRVPAFFLACALLVTGCAVAPVRPESQDAFTHGDYEKVLDRWSRSASIYEGITMHLLAHATWVSAPFHRAQLAFREQREALTQSEVVHLRAAHEARLQSEVVFFLAVHTSQWQWNHLDRGEGGVFRLRLRTSDGVEREPIRIERLRVEKGLDLLFPYLEPQWTGYWVSFPATVDGHGFTPRAGASVTLLVTGVPGNAPLVWKVEN